MNKPEDSRTDSKPSKVQQSGDSSILMREALYELQASNEELRVAEEQMRSQNDALAEAALLLQA